MRMTSAVANKLLKKYNEELQKTYEDEAACSIYVEIDGVNPVVPEYDFHKVRCHIETLMCDIITLKHAINVFNSTTTLQSFNMTIDEALVYMAMLTKEKNHLESMIKPVNKKLKTGLGVRNNQIEYEVVNYDVDGVRENYKNICKKLTDLQVDLDVVNSTVTFEVEGLSED